MTILRDTLSYTRDKGRQKYILTEATAIPGWTINSVITQDSKNFQSVRGMKSMFCFVFMNIFLHLAQIR